MTTITTFSRFTTPEGKVSMIWESYAGESVKITLSAGDTVRCTITGTGKTPDDEPLVLVDGGKDGNGHLFADDIVQVEG